MENVKTTLFPESTNRATYFDVEEGIRIYEEAAGTKVSEESVALIRNFASVINRAYEDGFRDGSEVAAHE